MNYRKVYRNIIVKAKKENRKKGCGVYYEKHHIIPAFMFKDNKRNKNKINMGHLDGNPNASDNMVLLTPREHFLCHVLLYKIHVGSMYEYKCGAALMLFFNVAESKHVRVKDGKFHTLSKKYEKYRKIGLQSISNSKKNMIVVKDAITGIIIGSVENTHPKILRGEWVHHSKGKTLSDEHIEAIRYNSKYKNSNARNYDLNYIRSKIIDYNEIITKYDYNFIMTKFFEWFDSMEHEKEFITAVNSNTKINQTLSNVNFELKRKIKDIALEVSIEYEFNWNFPKWGMSKYKGV